MTYEEELLTDLGSMSSDPLSFVLWAFPWGNPDGELASARGPEAWQIDILTSIRDNILTVDEAIRVAVASGHGVGKSALVAWLILWAFSTFEDTKGVVTANTENQLKTKTWAELSKWFRLFIARDFFHLTATKLYARDPLHEDTWRVDMVPWSERNTEAFAGLHNQGKRILLIMDEASAIPDVIWETAEGALTDQNTQILWLVFGNPTRSTGRFRACFPGGKFQHRWKHRAVDSREVSITNKTQIDKWIKDYGEDHDFVRIRVKGVFPRTGEMEFISETLVDEAIQRPLIAGADADPLVFGVDVARFGDDVSVIFIRHGKDARTYPPIILRKLDLMVLAGRVAEEYTRLHPDAVFIDGGGMGGGVVDRLRQLNVPVIDIAFQSKADRTNPDNPLISYANKRAEMWGAIRGWLEYGCLPADELLRAELITPLYGYDAQNRILLESKDSIRGRGASSPNIADALALTFAYPVASKALMTDKFGRPVNTFTYEYDPFSPENMVA
jgi:hypothetical protein